MNKKGFIMRLVFIIFLLLIIILAIAFAPQIRQTVVGITGAIVTKVRGGILGNITNITGSVLGNP